MSSTTFIPPGLDTPTGVRAGIDIVRTDDVVQAVEQFGQRYLCRLFTAHELFCCVGEPEVAAASLAARLAAKEATIKVLRPTGAQPDWRSIEVIRREGGACDLALHASAARMAADAGLGPLSVSLTHEAGFAAAVVVALAPQDQHPIALPVEHYFADPVPVANAAAQCVAQICPEKGTQHGRFRSVDHR